MATSASPTKKPRNLPHTSEEAPAEARTQADEYDSIFGSTDFVCPDNGDIIKVPPHPQYAMLDDDRMDEWDELLFTVDTEYEREPDIIIPAQELDNGLKIPGDVQRGAVMVPYRRKKEDGKSELVKPSHSIKVVQVALGMDTYQRLRDGGGNASDVWKIWGRQSLLAKERQQRDSFPPAGRVALAAVPETDS